MPALLFNHAPFDQLTAQEVEELDRQIKVVYFPAGQTLIHAGESTDCLFWIIKGKVEESAQDRLEAVHEPAELIDLDALLSPLSRHTFVAREDCLCYSLPKTTVQKLGNQNQSLNHYLALSLENTRQLLNQGKSAQAVSQLVTAPILVLQLPTCTPLDGQISLKQLAVHLASSKQDAQLVDCNGQLGLITLTDINRALTQPSFDLHQPIASLCTLDLLTLKETDSMMQAQQAMLNNDLHHLVVKKARGHAILESKTLLSYLSNQSHWIVQKIQQTQNPEALVNAALESQRMIHTLFNQGTRTEHIMQLVSQVNRQIFIRLYDLLIPSELKEQVCLFVMGSEGREEQIFRTDQDNGLILSDPSQRHLLIAFRQAFNSYLLKMGYPPCPGNIMLTHDLWCQTLSGYREQINQWVGQYLPENTIFLSALSDAKGIAGNTILCEALRTNLHEALQEHTAFLPIFARSLSQFEVPLGLFNDFSLSVDKQHKQQLDIKKGGLFALVHGLRCLALEKGLTQTNSLERLDALRKTHLLDKQLAEDLREAFSFMSQLRLEAMIESHLAHEPMSNFITPAHLSSLEKHLLKSCLKTVKRFKRLLEHHFHLERLG